MYIHSAQIQNFLTYISSNTLSIPHPLPQTTGLRHLQDQPPRDPLAGGPHPDHAPLHLPGGGVLEPVHLRPPRAALGPALPGLPLRRRHQRDQPVDGVRDHDSAAVVPERARNPGRVELAQLELGAEPDGKRGAVQHGGADIGNYRE